VLHKIIVALLLPLGVAGGVGATLAIVPTQAPTPSAAKTENKEDATSVKFARDRWESAGIKTEPVAAAPLADYAWRTGRVALNEDRLAHISPPVEGVVREVRVRLGQDVTAGEVLAVLDSKEISKAKLDLVTARAALEAEREREKWVKLTAANIEELVVAVTSGKSVADIATAFKERPVGEGRKQLMTAYTSRNQLRAQLESEKASGAVVSELARKKTAADLDAAEATLQSLSEELKFQARQQTRLAELKLKEAVAAYDVSRVRLLTLGYSAERIEAMDPIAEGANASLWEVRAPFAGTVVDQHAVRSERVDPQFQMFQLVDLSTVWIRGDAFEADLPLLRGLNGRSMVFRAPGAGVGEQPAKVFYSGDIVDRASRAVTVTATAPNPDRVLKPGMFVDVGLPRGNDAPVVQVPLTAVQRHQGKTFVFVLKGEDDFERTDVELGREGGDRVEVTSGLKPGAVVVVGGGFVLKSELYRDQMAGGE
jgi:RND family efflux transporter MFP subunit